MNQEQTMRLEAIKGAAEVLGRKTEGAFKAVSHPDVCDIVDLAEYIVVGEHPMERYRDQFIERAGAQ